MITLAMPGIPVAEWRDYCEPVHAAMDTPPDSPDVHRVAELHRAMGVDLLSGLHEIRENPRPGMVDAIARATIDGEKPDDLELLGVLSLLIGGGFDTTTASTSHALERLPPNPDQREIPSAERDTLLDSATEEFRDPEQLTNPDEIDLERKGNRHFRFGLDVHLCIGSAPARTMFKRMLAAVLDRLPDLHRDPEGTIHYDPTLPPTARYIRSVTAPPNRPLPVDGRFMLSALSSPARPVLHDDSGREVPRDTPTGVALERAIAGQVRKLRLAIGLSVGDMAARIDISEAMLSKIENAQTSRSLSTLARLAAGLDVPVTSLFRGADTHREAVFVKAGTGAEIVGRGTRVGHHYELLGGLLGQHKRLEPVLVTLTDASEAFPLFQHPGTELLYMLEGEMLYGQSESEYRLQPGGALLLDGEGLDGPNELVSLPIRFLAVTAYPDNQD